MKSNPKYKKKNNDKSLVRLGVIAVISFALILSFLSIGFALYSKTVTIDGSVKFKKNGDFGITNVIKTTSSNTDNQVPTFTSHSVNFNLNFIKSNEENPVYMATYDIVFTNDSFYDRTISALDFSFSSIDEDNNSLGNVDYTVEGVDSGGVVPKLSTSTATVTIVFTPTVDNNTYHIDGEAEVTSNSKPDGNLVAALNTPTTGNIKDGRIASFSVNVLSTYEDDITFELYPVSNKIVICDSNGDALDPFTITGNNEGQNFTFYVKAAPNAEFPNDTLTTSILLRSTGLPNTNAGSITLDVDKNEEYNDITPPTISNVTATISDTIGEVNLTWNGEDDYSGVDHYTILVCDQSGNIIRTITTNNDSTSYTVTGLSNGATATDYIFKVYGTDASNNANTASQDDIANATVNSGYCSRTDSAAYQWVFSVTVNINNGESSGPTTVNRNQTYEGTVTANRNYSLPDTITVSMGENNLNTNQYTYSQTNGSIRIDNVTGNITITVRCNYNICLVEGTKVLLADGTYKNIEDIRYTDLLSVWSYDTGSIDYEYPIWIENGEKGKYYQLNTFSDGTTLKTIGYHGIFSVTHNQFISVDDYDKFKVGTEVYKVENNRLKKVKVTNIEIIEDDIKFYHVVSSRYYNIIANDLLTTDGTVILSNLYGFDENVKWPKIREELLKDDNNKYTYDDLKDVLPHYMFVGLRAEEGKILSNYGLTLELFKGYLAENQSKEGKYLEVDTNRNKERLFMVTTSLDIVNKLNMKNYMYVENSYYTLPKDRKVKCYLNSVDKVCYKGGEKVKITSPIYFKAISNGKNE